MAELYELKLKGRRSFVLWAGESGEDAACDYVAAHPEAVVIATRNHADQYPLQDVPVMALAKGRVRIWS